MKYLTTFSSFSLVVLFIIVSCTSTPRMGDDMDAAKHKNLVFPSKLINKPVYVDTILAYDFGKYKELNYKTDYTLGVSSSKSTPLSEEYVYAFSNDNRNKFDRTKSSAEIDPCTLLIDDIQINNRFGTKATESKTANLKKLFGQNTRFKFLFPGQTKSDDLMLEETLYIPEIIQINAPKIETEEDLYPLCDYKSFKLEWNADPKNENGVIVMIEWSGLMLFGNDYPMAFIRRMDLLPETGEEYLNLHLFDGIPDTALCTMTLIRGSVDTFLLNDYSFQVFGESHESLAFVLLREIKSIDQ